MGEFCGAPFRSVGGRGMKSESNLSGARRDVKHYWSAGGTPAARAEERETPGILYSVFMLFRDGGQVFSQGGRRRWSGGFCVRKRHAETRAVQPGAYCQGTDGVYAPFYAHGVPRSFRESVFMRTAACGARRRIARGRFPG